MTQESDIHVLFCYLVTLFLFMSINVACEFAVCRNASAADVERGEQDGQVLRASTTGLSLLLAPEDAGGVRARNGGQMQGGAQVHLQQPRRHPAR